MDMLRFAFISIITLFLFACSSVREGEIYRQFNEDEVQVGNIDNDEFIFEVAYVGAIGHSYIFECYVKNVGDETIFIDKSQFALALEDGTILSPNSEGEIISTLKSDRRSLKKRKKSSTILGGVVVGLSILAGATNGVSAGESILYNADPIIGIFDERRWYQRNIESVEDEIEYVKNAQFNDHLLSPGEETVRDILFPTVKINSDVDFVLEMEDQEFVITFPENIFR